MKLHALAIENFRSIEHLEFNDIPSTGVIVISGDNEQGKSTILEAVETVLEIAHGSKAQKIKDLQPRGRDTAPRVELTASIGPYRFTVAKQWLRKASVTLNITEPRRENLTGRQADDRLAELLSDYTDEALRSALFVHQGEERSALESAGIPTLTKALEQAAGKEDARSSTSSLGDLGEPGDSDDALLAAVEQEYQRYYTPKGRPRGELSNAQQDAERLSERRNAAEEEVDALSGYVDEVARIEQESKRARAALPDALEAEHSAEAAVVQAQAIGEKAAAADKELHEAGLALGHARTAVNRRQELIDEIEQVTVQVTQLKQQRDAENERAEKAADTVSALTEELKKAQQKYAEVEEHLTSRRREHSLLQERARRLELSRKIAALDDLDAEIKELTALADSTVTDDDIAAVEQAVTERTIAERLAQAKAARLEFSAPNATSITVDGQDYDIDSEPTTITLSEHTTFVIGGVTATYHAGVSDDGSEVTSGQDPLTQAQQKVTELLGALQHDSLAELRATREKTRRAKESREALLRQQEAILDGANAADLRAELDGLAKTQEEEEEISKQRIDEITQEVKQHEKDLVALRGEVELAESRLEPWREDTATLALTAVRVRLEAAEDNLSRLQQRLEGDDRDGNKEELDAALVSAQQRFRRAEEAAQSLREELAVADPELAAELLAGARAKTQNLQDMISTSSTRKAELTGRIDQALGAEERLEKLSAEEENARHQLESATRRATAVAVLKETLLRHRDVARARYAAPLTRKLTSLARVVFGPEVSFELDDDLKITTRSIGEIALGLGELSGGAKEQLALLTRFAVAGLVGEPEDGAGVPVFIDDALGSTDEHRLDRMAALITQVGKLNQVFVLTCVPARYQSVIGKREYPIAELKL